MIRNFLTFGRLNCSRLKQCDISRQFIDPLNLRLTRAISIQSKVEQQHQTNTSRLTERQNNENSLNFSIISNEYLGDSRDLVDAGSQIELSDLELELKGRKIYFNLTWLRDSCRCTKCSHEHSRQRLFTPNDFRKPMFAINDVSIKPKHELEDRINHDMEGRQEKQDQLMVKWSDGHESLYSLDWLIHVDALYRESKLNLETKSMGVIDKFLFPRDDFYFPYKQDNMLPQHWSVAKINSSMCPIDYRDLFDGYQPVESQPSTYINATRISEMSSKRYEAILGLVEQLAIYGLAKITNVPTERDEVLKVVRSLAYERPTGYGTVFDVVVEPSEEINLAYSAQVFDLHTDLPYRETSPGVQLLHCIQNSVDGGYSYFSDVHNAAQRLRESDPKLFDVLLQFPATFVVRDPYRDMKFRRQRPVLSLDYQGQLDDVYYSPFMLPPIGHKEDVKLFYLAIDKLTRLLQSKDNKLVTKMEPGELFIFNNRRVLHGRGAYDPSTGQRFLQGCYMDWDEIRSLHEKLVYNKKPESR